jgi:creatinine amidohydrolase/Fe(II)-dependent formamide hydrolase-like protein
MSAKRPSLADSMRAVATEAPPPSPPRPVEKPATAVLPAQSKAFYAATRLGKKKATATLSEAAHTQLKALSVDRHTTVEALLTEAINDLFRKHGKAAIA